MFNRVESQVTAKIRSLLSIGGSRSPHEFHRELGKIMWNYCGMSRTTEGLRSAIAKIQQLKQDFWQDLYIPGSAGTFNQTLESAGRVADFLSFGELMCQDALAREESCGGHFREEHQTSAGEAKRDDQKFAHVAVWQHVNQDRGSSGVKGDEMRPIKANSMKSNSFTKIITGHHKQVATTSMRACSTLEPMFLKTT